MIRSCVSLTAGATRGGTMETFETIGELQIHSEQRARFISEGLCEEWAATYPQLFDANDLQIARNQAHLGYHYYEWLAAILLYHAWGYLSLVEHFEFKSHERKQSILRKLVTTDVIALMTDRRQHGRTQCPDLLVYKPDLSEWFFCEVKGPGDRLSSRQKEYFQALAEVSGEPIRIIRFRITGEPQRQR
jgi:hypothetical protein